MKRIEDIIIMALMVANDHNLTLNASGVLKLANNVTKDIKKALWHDAQGDDLPEIDREVIVMDKKGMVCFGHRPVESFTGVSLTNHSEMEEYYPERYGKGEWNIPDVKWWLDVDIPKPE